MVTKDTARRHAGFMREWAARLPSGIASLQESQAAHEWVLRIVPLRAGASSVEFRLGDYGGFGLYLGVGFSLEELPWSDSLVTQVLDSVRQGRFRESVWEWRGQVVRTTGSLTLNDGRVLRDRGFRIAGLLGLGAHREIEYLPWE